MHKEQIWPLSLLGAEAEALVRATDSSPVILASDRDGLPRAVVLGLKEYERLQGAARGAASAQDAAQNASSLPNPSCGG